MNSDYFQVDQYELDVCPGEEISMLQALDAFATIAEISMELEWCMLQYSSGSLTLLNILRRLIAVVIAETHKHNSVLSKYQDLKETIQRYIKRLKISLALGGIVVENERGISILMIAASTARAREVSAILRKLLVPQMCRRFRNKVLLIVESIMGSCDGGDLTEEIEKWIYRLQKRVSELKEAEMELGIWRRRLGLNYVELLCMTYLLVYPCI
jgi:hypothetical protein